MENFYHRLWQDHQAIGPSVEKRVGKYAEVVLTLVKNIAAQVQELVAGLREFDALRARKQQVGRLLFQFLAHGMRLLTLRATRKYQAGLPSIGVCW